MANNKKLIVGKNSSIVKMLRPSLEDFDFCSHSEINHINLESYDHIFIFSWDFKRHYSNLLLLKKFPLDRVIFISSISVLALAKRKQWADYPNAKLACENLVLSEKGKVIRIGIWNLTHLDYLSGLIPITTPHKLLNTMGECTNSNESVFWPVDYAYGKLSGGLLALNVFLNKVSEVLPPRKIFQLPLAALAKTLRLKSYSYSYDCLNFFSDHCVIGFGVIGSAVGKKLKEHKLEYTVVCSVDSDEHIQDKGFRDFRIGRFREGLSKFWHGAHIVENDCGQLKKHVPIYVKRSRLPKSSILATVSKLNCENTFPYVCLTSPSIADCRIFSKHLHLATGVINNIRILQKIYPISTRIAEHEVGCIGIVDSHELIKLGLLSYRFGVVFGRYVIKSKTELGHEYVVDFRPGLIENSNVGHTNIFNNRTAHIVHKLITKFSLGLINQAMFNKFGFGFYTKKCSVFLQIEAPKCISISYTGGIARTRLSADVFENVSRQLSERFGSFTNIGNIATFDGIHAYGGFDLGKINELRLALESNRLFIHCNEFSERSLGAYHHSMSLIKAAEERIDDFAEKNVKSINSN